MLLSFLDVFSNVKVLVSVGLGIIAILLSIFLIKKYRLNSYQIIIFVLYMVFWFSIIIARDYRKAFAAVEISAGGLQLGEAAAAVIAGAYGLVSIFARITFFGLSDIFRTRKFFICFALVVIAGTSIAVVINPCYITLFMSSLAFGLGASLLAMFNVMFAETFDQKQTMASVSILSIAPLIAELLVAPLQYYATQNTPRDYAFMWLVSAIFAIGSLIFILFVKEKRPTVKSFTKEGFKTALTDYRFIIICFMGILISFIKFSTAGSNMTRYSNLVNMDAMMVAYLGVLFAVTQLGSSVLMGTVLTKRIGVKWTLILGVTLSTIFSIIGGVITNPIILFVAYGLNGIGYGLTYNVLIGLAIRPFGKDIKDVTMGIFQTFFAVGIWLGDKIYNFVISVFGGNLSGIALYQRTYLITAVVCVITIILCFVAFRNYKGEGIEEKKEKIK